MEDSEISQPLKERRIKDRRQAATKSKRKRKARPQKTLISNGIDKKGEAGPKKRTRNTQNSAPTQKSVASDTSTPSILTNNSFTNKELFPARLITQFTPDLSSDPILIPLLCNERIDDDFEFS
ncbi:hypothetical protein MXB_1075 [Myxobolus squamalis]|nr:hypothetical protein MXB_1075 [Myxobolus squamalis]